MTFADTCLMVFRAKGFTPEDIEEAKQAVREAWPDVELRAMWISWIDNEFKVCK